MAASIVDAASKLDVLRLATDGASAEPVAAPPAVRRTADALAFLTKRVEAYEATTGAMMLRLRGYAETERLRSALDEQNITPRRRSTPRKSSTD